MRQKHRVVREHADPHAVLLVVLLVSQLVVQHVSLYADLRVSLPAVQWASITNPVAGEYLT